MAAFVANGPATRGELDGLPNSINLVTPGVYTATASGEFAAPAGCVVIEAVYNQTAGTAGQSVTVGIDAFDPSASTPGSPVWENLITSTARVSATTDNVVVSVNPMVPPISNATAQRAVRRRMRVTVTHTGAQNVTYGIAVHAS